MHRPHRLALPGDLRGSRGLTLVETMISMTLLAMTLLGFLGSFVQSRRVTESSVLHAAATGVVYGIIEQMKGIDYNSSLPSATIDDADPGVPVGATEPYYTVRVRINQDKTVWLRTVYTAAGGTPQGPTTTPDASATAASLGAIDNFVGSIPLSTVTGTTSQSISLNLWLWVDEIPDTDHDVAQVKKVTLVYTYSYLDGGRTRTVRDREVFIRTRYDQ
jgi:Tfp pilus assembly protein PilV